MSIWSNPIILEDFVGTFCPAGISSSTSTLTIVTSPNAKIDFENTTGMDSGSHAVVFDSITKEVNFTVSGVAYHLRADLTSTTVKKVQLVSPSVPRDVQEWEAVEET